MQSLNVDRRWRSQSVSAETAGSQAVGDEEASIERCGSAADVTQSSSITRHRKKLVLQSATPSNSPRPDPSGPHRLFTGPPTEQRKSFRQSSASLPIINSVSPYDHIQVVNCCNTRLVLYVFNPPCHPPIAVLMGCQRESEQVSKHTHTPP